MERGVKHFCPHWFLILQFRYFQSQIDHFNFKLKKLYQKWFLCLKITFFAWNNIEINTYYNGLKILLYNKPRQVLLTFLLTFEFLLILPVIIDHFFSGFLLQNLPALSGFKNVARTSSSTVTSQSKDNAPQKVQKEPYSPFQNTNNAVEYALARLDDLLNWGRKCRIFKCHQ